MIVNLNGNKKKILFYVQRNLHLPFLEPIFDYMNENCDFDLYFSAPEYVQAENGSSGVGLPENEVLRLKKKANYIDHIQNFKPDATIIADVYASYGLKHTGKIINVGHGLISKGWFYTDGISVRRENFIDLSLVPGQWHKDILSKNIFHPIEVTGFVKSDLVFGEKTPTKDELLDFYDIPKENKVILYAPTFNMELSSIPCLKEKITEVIEENTVLLIKLHGMTGSSYVEMYKNLASDNKKVIFIDDIDLSSAMVMADVMISDVSSAFVEFLLLNKPVIIYRNPEEVNYPGYNEDDIEYKVREATIVVENIDQLKLAVKLSLLNPAELEDKRQKWLNHLDYGQDGKVVKRISEKVYELLFTDKYRRKSEYFSVVCMWKNIPDDAEIEYFLERLELSNPDHNIEVYMVSSLVFDKAHSNYHHLWIENPLTGFQSIRNILDKLSHDKVVFIQSDVVFPNDFLQSMSYYFNWFEDSGAVMAISEYDDYPYVLENSAPGANLKKLSDIGEVFSKLLIGHDVKVPNLYDFCYMIDKKKFFTLNINEKDYETIASFFSENFLASGYTIRFALDVFVYTLANASKEI